ncbi:MAG: type VII secretion protein EssC [Clostridia bacterium]|nr:type VII secretion protein EssC [Clostridia bacterium]
MILTVIGKDKINSLTLPQKVKGQFWLYSSLSNNTERIVNVEGINNQWIMKSNKNYKIVNGKNEPFKNTVLEESSIYVIKGKTETLYIYTEPMTADRQIFSKHLFKGDLTLSIGRSEQNDIIYDNKFSSSKHAILSCSGGKWFIQDCNSSNGTFVNLERCSKNELKIGDVVFIVGLKIIIGKNFFAINNPDGKVLINSKAVQTLINQEIVDTSSEDEEESYEEKEFFSRTPRFKRDINKAEIKIDTPPQSPLSQEMPWFLIMGSSMAMGMMSIVTLVSAIATFNITSIFMGGSMLIGTVLLPTVSKKYEKKMQKKKEKLRQKKYREYLDSISLRINEECQLQEEILRENFVDTDECIRRIKTVSTNLWEREAGQNDFLTIRLGIGEGKLNADLQYSEKKFTLDEDNLQEELYSLCDTPRKLKNVPITVSIFDNYISGIIGPKELSVVLAYNIIFQLSAYYSFDEVKFVFLFDNKDEGDFGFTRWLPHVWNDDKSFRFVATNYEEVKVLSSYLEQELDYRSSKNHDDMDEISPYYIVFSFSNHLSKSAEFLKRIFSEKKNLNISVMNFRKEFKKLPKECSTIIELFSDDKGRVFDKNRVTEETVEFVPDKFGDYLPEEISKQLSNILLESESQKYSLPKMIGFMDMFKVGKIEHLNVFTRWSENDPTKSLQTPVGVDTQGNLFNLDLHEKFHGPHGLVAGMTGSGKSEFIITYILSMAVNYHPNEVAFILIDYKGGGLAGAFVDEEKGIKLPHVAGTITNLDGASITRSLISIQSELRRRQGIFNEARKVSNEGTIDIYKYQKLYRKGLVKEPLPHLFIISDEFAELKTQQPEFMEQLISAARIGRSLGVHLILATQKPSGVVDDQIWSNSRFRVCLKVQEKADSMDMIKRPDAASLSDTGRFYLQVGFNEYFDMGQSAWCGAPYIPTEKVKKKYDNSIKVVNNLGQALTEVKPREEGVTGNEPKQIVSFVQYLSNLANEENISVRPLWLDPIPDRIFVPDLEEKYGYKKESYVLNPVVGEYDDPFNQSQNIMCLPISQEGHAIVYGSTGSGTETFLETLTFSLIKNHSADEINIYVLDFGSETMGAFKKAPQVGDVLFSSDEEKIVNLFKMITKEVEKRKKLFSEYGGNYNAFIAKNKEKPENIVVIINNFAVFSELFEEQDDMLASISRECQKYGIFFVIAASASNAVRYRLQQNFKQLILLQMNDPSDYSGILGQTDGVCPSKIYGRGIVKYDKVYEFQTALASDESDIMEFYRDYSLKLSKKSPSKARKVPILPSVVDYDFIKSELTDLTQVPVGVNKQNLRISKIDFSNKLVFNVLSNDLMSAEPFACSLGYVFEKLGCNTTIVDSIGQLSGSDYTLVNEDYDQAIVQLFDELVERNNVYKDSGMNASSLADYEKKTYIFFGLKTLFDVLDEDSSDKLKVLLEKAELEYKINFIVFDEVSSVSEYSFNSWYKKQVVSNEGIWIGDGLYNQYILKLNRPSSSNESMDSSLGYIVSKGKETLVKLIDVSEKESADYE